MSDILKVYEHWGFEGKVNGKEANGDCVFCDKRNKMYVNVDNGMFNCKSCGIKGNKYNFLTEIHDFLLSERSDEDYQNIKELRGSLFNEAIIDEFGLCSNGSDIIIPIRSHKSKNLVNLRKWSSETKVSYNTPTLCTLYEAIWRESGPVFLVEGEWDAIALYKLCKRAKRLSDVSIVAVPGVDTFKDSWVDRFQNREVYLLFDNDYDRTRKNGEVYNPAKDGMVKTCKKLVNVAKYLHTINWEKVEPELPDGYDIKDYAEKMIPKRKATKAFNTLINSCEEVINPDMPKLRRLERTSLDQVVDDFKKYYSLNPSYIDTIACAISTIVSLRVVGDPLWLFIVGPPSCGKTSIIEAFEAADDYAAHMSKLTSTALVSGKPMDDGSDPSFLNKLRNLTLFVKDFTAVIAMGAQEKEKLFGVLRDAYDGRYIQHYGTGETKTYDNLYFSIIAGVTDAIHGENRSSLGERFLKIEVLDDDFDEDQHMEMSLKNVGVKNDAKEVLQSSVTAFLDYLKTQELQKEIPQVYLTRLIALSKLVAIIRTQVNKTRGDDIAFRPRREVGTRIAKQLQKLGIALTLVLGKPKFDKECYRVLQKVGMDSCSGLSVEFVQILSREAGLTADDFSSQMQISIKQIERTLKDCLTTGLLKMETLTPNIKRGKRARREPERYYLSDNVDQLLKDANLKFPKYADKRFLETAGGL